MTALTSSARLPRFMAASPGTMVLDITAGLHQGVSLALDRDLYQLGSGEAADLVLHDPAIAPLHLRIRPEGGQLTLEAVGGSVGIHTPGQKPWTLAQGHGHRARLPVRLRLGEAELKLHAPQAGAPRPAQGWRPHWLLALALLLICVSAFALRQPAQPSVPAQAVATPQPGATPATPAQAKAWLDEQLHQAGLASISSETGDHQVIAHGSFMPSQKARWTSVQQGFDRQFGPQLGLRGDVAQHAASETPRVRFQAVWAGPNPYVIDGSGKRLYPGAALEDRWVLERIEANQIVLVRGDERFTFTL
ncbi:MULTISPECIES: FHA domain-containing protein [unclassified Pseudomonas]|nr:MULTISPECIES: FHA domain-containing protein [unclassified Pseudomonas]